MSQFEGVADKVIEPAKTGRSKCKSCDKTIEKTSLRVGISFVEGAGLKWYHLGCFPVSEIVSAPEELDGYSELNETQQNSVKDQMNAKVAPTRAISGDKLILPPNVSELSEQDREEINQVKAKIEEIKPITAEKLRELLIANGQYSAGTKGDLLIRAADVMVRGDIPKCPTCQHGFLYWSEPTQDYFCKGYTPEGEGQTAVKCEAVFPKEQIQRTPCTIPDTFYQKKERKRKEKASFLEEETLPEQEKKEEEEPEEDTGMRKRRKSAGIRNWSKDFIYQNDEDSEENQENTNQQPQSDQQPDQPSDQQQPDQNNIPSNFNSYFNTVINTENPNQGVDPNNYINQFIDN